MSKATCKGTRKDGTPCRNPARRGADVCRWHGAPGIPEVYMQGPFTAQQKDELRTVLDARFGKDRYKLLEVVTFSEGEPPAAIVVEFPDEETAKRAHQRVRLPITTLPVRLPTQHHLNRMVSTAFLSKIEQWKYSEHLQAFYIETGRHGRVVAEYVTHFDALRLLCDRLGAEGLQYTYAAVSAYSEYIKRALGEFPKTYEDLKPLTVSAAELLRVMGRRPQGAKGGYSRQEQMTLRKFLKAAAALDFQSIRPTHDGKAAFDAGPILAILHTRTQGRLRFNDEEHEQDEPVEITFILGKGFYELLRAGAHWLPKKLLAYHPINDKYAIAIGLYLCDMLAVRRNKKGQESVALGTIEREAHIDQFDSSERRRLPKIEVALHKLAQDGVIGGGVNPDTGKTEAVITPPEGSKRLSSIEAIRVSRLRLTPPPNMLPYLHPQALPELLSEASECTTKAG